MLSKPIVGGRWRMIPGREAVTVTLNRATPVSVSVSDAWRKEPTGQDMTFSGVDLQQNVTKWCVPNELLNPADEGHEIRKSDDIVAADGTYSVLTAKLVSLGSRWECVCSRTALA